MHLLGPTFPWEHPAVDDDDVEYDAYHLADVEVDHLTLLALRFLPEPL